MPAGAGHPAPLRAVDAFDAGTPDAARAVDAVDAVDAVGILRSNSSDWFVIGL